MRDGEWERARGAAVVVMAGTGLSTAVLYSIFQSPCKSRRLVELAVVSE